VQGVADGRLVDGLGRQLAAADLLGQAAAGVHQLGPAAVVDRQAQDHAGIVPTDAAVLVDLAQYRGRQSLPAADGREADVLLHDLGALGDEEAAQQRHEEVQLRLGPLPVLDAEAVEGELTDAEPAALLDGAADAVDALAVALDA